MFHPFLQSNLRRYKLNLFPLNLFPDVEVPRIKLFCFITVILQCWLFVVGWKLSDSSHDLTAAPLVLLRALIFALSPYPIRHLWKRNRRLLVVVSSMPPTATISIALLASTAGGKLPVTTSPQCILCLIPLLTKWLAYKGHGPSTRDQGLGMRIQSETNSESGRPSSISRSYFTV